ncbi:MAG: hypothetical protein ACFB16_24660 [Phormidesmis sp.]
MTKGLPEVVAYLSLATKAERHSVESSTIEWVKIQGLAPDSWLQLKLPKVVFYR